MAAQSPDVQESKRSAQYALHFLVTSPPPEVLVDELYVMSRDTLFGLTFVWFGVNSSTLIVIFNLIRLL